MRHVSLDYFRVLCAFTVVIIHSMRLDYKNIYANGTTLEQSSLCSLIVLFSLSVPGFVLLSGAFNLNRKVDDVYKFYFSSIKKIGLYYFPFLIINFFVYKVFIPFYMGRHVDIISEFLKCVMKGSAGVEWFMPMILGLYLLTPLLLKIKALISEYAFCWMTITILAITHLAIDPFLELYNISLSDYFLAPLYLGLYMLGGCLYGIRQLAIQPRLVLVFFSFIFLAIVSRMVSILQFSDALPIGIADSRSMIGLIMSSFLFLFFLYVKLPDSSFIRRISQISILIYLIHPLCLIGQTLIANFIGLKFSQCSFIEQFTWSSVAIIISVVCAHFLDVVISRSTRVLIKRA